MRNLELPARMSPCVRLFIELLLDEVDDNRFEKRGFPSSLSGTITRMFGAKFANETEGRLA